jgi:hypothetical protein
MAAKKGQRNIHQDEPIGMLPKDNHTSEKRWCTLYRYAFDFQN